MTSFALRLCVAAVTMLVFFVLWAVIAAKPWASAAAPQGRDPRLVALDRRQRRLTREARLVKRELDRRWHAYRLQLRRREARIRTLERRHAEQVVAAARLASAASSYASPAAAVPVASSGARVVALPPQVRVVTLPPAAAPATSFRELTPMRDVASVAKGRYE
jgi:riboflavin biosynthesis pyrimidine reductase